MTLTAIGLSTAFGLLVVMMIIVGLMHLLVKQLLERPAGRPWWRLREVKPPTQQELSDRALAAIAAVTVLLSNRGAGARP